MFITLPYQKYKVQPEIRRGLPVVGFLNRRGEAVPFRKGQWLAPVVYQEPPKKRRKPTKAEEKARKAKRASRKAAEARKFKRPAKPSPAPKKPAKGRTRPDKPPKKTPAEPLPPTRAVFPKFWVDTDDVRGRLAEEFEGIAPDPKASSFGGYLYTPSNKPSAKKPDYFRRTLWASTNLPSLRRDIIGFIVYCVVEPDDYEGREAKHKGASPFILTGSVISWHGPLGEIMEMAYAPSPTKGKTYQSVVPYRTKLDDMIERFYENIGQLKEIVAVEPRLKFSTKEERRIRGYQRRYKARLRKQAADERKRKRLQGGR